MNEKKEPVAPGVGAEARAINAEFDATGVRFHDRAETLATLKQDGRDVVFDDGVPKILYDGELLPLRESLLRLAYDRRDLADGRTLPREGVGTSRPGLASKADYPDRKSKLAAIAERGLEWWEALPLTGASPTSEVTTREQFLKLPSQERMRRYAADPTVLAKLPSAKTRQNGAFINVKGIERHLASRGKLAK